MPVDTRNTRSHVLLTWYLLYTSQVVGNAIRTIGHLVSLAFHPRYRDIVAFNDWDAHSFYGNVISGLGAKVEAALYSESCRNSSWKQRSTANKHGWGACNSLALVLNCGEAFTMVNLKHTQDALVILVQCIDNAGSLHEKVASAATGAIRKIPETVLARISDGSGVIGMALARCLLRLYRMKKLHHQQKKARLTQELEVLLKHLLWATNISDACLLLKHEDVEKNTLDFLYDWMVKENMPLTSFESFALALQRKDLIDDAALQQRFASRALQMYRSTDGSQRNATQESEFESLVDDDDNDNDEL